jgi:hypothetical protein
MNDRIKQLALQACVHVLTTKGMEDIVDGCYIVSPDKLDKFAELIVRECMQLNSKELSITAIERLLPLYAEHFGINV